MGFDHEDIYPVVDTLKNWTGMKEGDSDATAVGKLEQAIGRVTPPPAPVATLESFSTPRQLLLSGRPGF
jgi:hypothetical protein